jgi:hypothetical protein
MAHAGEHIPAAPFIAWLEDQIDKIRRDDTLRDSECMKEVPAERILADRLGVAPRIFYRYRRGLISGSRNGIKGDYPTETFTRASVENMLDRVGKALADLYPDLDEDIELEPDLPCPTCREVVTPLGGCCPWCDTALRADAHGKRAA